MTWKEFKDKLEADGVKDDMLVRSLDIDSADVDDLFIDIEKNGFEVY